MAWSLLSIALLVVLPYVGILFGVAYLRPRRLLGTTADEDDDRRHLFQPGI